MKKISLYTFVTTFCLVPVTDWGAFIQRVIGRLLLAGLLLKLFQPAKTAAFHRLLNRSFDLVTGHYRWIFIKIGEIELRVFAMFLSAIMPDLFGTAGTAYTSWEQIWSQGLTALPSDMVQVINGLGVAQILGLITATWTAVSSVKIYRKVMPSARGFCRGFSTAGEICLFIHLRERPERGKPSTQSKKSSRTF